MSPKGILDTQTGEVSERLELENLLLSKPGGVISGTNLYEPLCSLIPQVRKDEGWTVSIHAQQQRVNPLTDDQRVKGLIYVSRLTYRFPKKGNRYKGERFRDPAIKWLVLNLELFADTTKLTPDEFLSATKAILRLARRRGINPKHSPASLSSALLRASPEWEKRNPAPHFISELARDYLPGNYYVIAERFKQERINHCYYLDQQSAHHKIASSVPMPHPHWLRARGRLRSVEEGNHPCWIDAKQVHLLRNHIGLLCCLVECDTIPGPLIHLYPPWTRERGTQVRWIWTPELRLFDRRVRLRHVCCGLTSIRLDTALWEYAEWSLEQLEGKRDKEIIKSTLLAAYGMLACRVNRTLHLYTVHGRRKPLRAELCELPLIKDVFRSTVNRVRVPAIQNTVARGIIEAETRTRSIEYARKLESEKIPVAQIYADGLLAVTDQLPLMLPEHWRVSAALTRVYSPHPNQIISDQLVKLPGFSSGRREAYLRKDVEGWHSREFEPSVSL